MYYLFWQYQNCVSVSWSWTSYSSKSSDWFLSCHSFQHLNNGPKCNILIYFMISLAPRIEKQDCWYLESRSTLNKRPSLPLSGLQHNRWRDVIAFLALLLFTLRALSQSIVYRASCSLRLVRACQVALSSGQKNMGACNFYS